MTINELNYVKSVLFSFSNFTGTAFNATASNFSGTWQLLYNVSSLAEGSHTIAVFANDSAGNVNQTQQLSLIVDFTVPSATIQLPLNDTGLINGSTAAEVFNTTVIDTNLSVQKVLFSFNNATGTAFNITADQTGNNWSTRLNISSLVAGVHSLTVLANDSLGNANNTELVQFVVNTLPVIDSVVLNTSKPRSNDTNSDVTAYAAGSDADNHHLKRIHNWLVNGSSLLLLNMPFERVNGTLTDNAYDYSGHKHNLSVNGNGLAWNKTGGFDGNGSYEFKGSGEYLQFSNPIFSTPINATRQQFSVGFWLKASQFDGRNHTLLSTRTGAGDDPGWSFEIDSSTSIVFRVRESAEKQQYATSLSINNNTVWIYVAGTWDGNRARISLDGSLHATSNQDQFPEIINDGNLRLGLGPTGLFDFNGTIDELSIWNTTLSQQVILDFHQARTVETIVGIRGDMLSPGQNWTVDVTPNDGYHDGAVVRSNQQLIKAVDSGPGAGAGNPSSPSPPSPSPSPIPTPPPPLQPVPPPVPPPPVIFVPAPGPAPGPTLPPEPGIEPIAVVQPPLQPIFQVPVTLVNPTDRVVSLQAEVVEMFEQELENEDNIRQILAETPACGNEVEQNMMAIKMLQRGQIQPIYARKYAEQFTNAAEKILDKSRQGIQVRTMSGVIYGDSFVCANLLHSEIVNGQEIILQPGEKVEKIIQIKRGLATEPNKIKVIFTEAGKMFDEKIFSLQESLITATAIDDSLPGNLFDVYFTVVSSQNGNNGEEPYLLELTLNKKPESKGFRRLFSWLKQPETVYSELHGPFLVQKNKKLIFAQQLEYDPAQYHGEYLARTKIYLKDKVIVEDEFEVTLD